MHPQAWGALAGSEGSSGDASFNPPFWACLFILHISHSLVPYEPQEAEAVMSFEDVPLPLTSPRPIIWFNSCCYLHPSLGKICAITSHCYFILNLKPSEAKYYVLPILWNLHCNVALKKLSSPSYLGLKKLGWVQRKSYKRGQEKYAKHCHSCFFLTGLISWTTYIHMTHRLETQEKWKTWALSLSPGSNTLELGDLQQVT